MTKRAICIETGQVFESIGAAAEFAGVAHANISAAVRGVVATSGGYHWQYAETAKTKPKKKKSISGMTIEEVQEEAARRTKKTGKLVRYAHIQIEETLALAKAQKTLHKPKKKRGAKG